MNAFFDELKCGGPRDLAGRALYFEKEFGTLGEDCVRVGNVAFCYRTAVVDCVWMLYLWHFGFHSSLSPVTILKKGVDLGQQYFETVRDDLATASREIDWFHPYSEAILMASLCGRTDERRELSDRLHSGLVVEETAIPIEPTLGDFLLCLASSFQTSPMDVGDVEERLRSSRKKRPKLLLNAWDALNGDDRQKFVSAIEASTANFAKTTAEDDLPIGAIAVLESILVALADEHGWTDLGFETKTAARIVTRSSLGLT
jgi:hypothetical protein